MPTWKKGDPPPGWTPTTWVRIPRFGLDRFYQGGQDEQGVKHSDYLYASTERSILQAPEVTEGMWIELFVDARNERALRFWLRQGFADIGTSEGNPRYRRFFRHPWSITTATAEGAATNEP